MKKFLILFWLSILTVFSQIDSTAIYDSGKVKFGFRLDLSNDALHGEDVQLFFGESKQSSGLGYGLALFFKQPVGKTWFMEHELSFSRSRIIFKFENDDEFRLSRLNSNLQPLNIGLKKSIFNFSAGPYLTALLNAHSKFKNNGGQSDDSKNIFGDARDEGENDKFLQKFDFGINFNISCQLKFGLLINLKLMQGFVPIIDNANVYTFDQDKNRFKIYNRSLLFGLGWAF
ncbi:MAG: outer membrane beta-barrel protein [Cytophagales bacterium]